MPLFPGELIFTFSYFAVLKVKSQSFSAFTNFLVEQLIKQLLNQEYEYEELRKSLGKLDMDLTQIYSYMNSKSDGKLTIQELKAFFLDLNIIYSEPELQCFSYRMTKFKTEHITQQQFMAEITPKTSIKLQI